MIKKRTGENLKKLFALFIVLSLVLQSGSGIFTAKSVLAQEETPTPEVAAEPSPTACPIEEPTPVPTQLPAEEIVTPLVSEPTSEPTSESTPIPTEEVSPTAVVTGESEVTPTTEISPEVTTEPITEVTIEPTSEPVVTDTPVTQETQSSSGVSVSVEPTSTQASPTEVPKELTVVVVEENQSQLPSLENACLVTDKPDYTPTEKVLISGSGFMAGAIYKLIISSQDEPPVNFETEVTADENGEFFYSY